MEKNPASFLADSSTCNCINNTSRFNINYAPSDLENPNNFDTRFNRYAIGMAINYPGIGSSGMNFITIIKIIPFILQNFMMPFLANYAMKIHLHLVNSIMRVAM